MLAEGLFELQEGRVPCQEGSVCGVSWGDSLSLQFQLPLYMLVDQANLTLRSPAAVCLQLEPCQFTYSCQHMSCHLPVLAALVLFCVVSGTNHLLFCSPPEWRGHCHQCAPWLDRIAKVIGKPSLQWDPGQLLPLTPRTVPAQGLEPPSMAQGRLMV